MPDSEEYQKLMKILANNMQMNFVKRILSPDLYPTMDLGNGDYATHKMAYSTGDGGAYVYPTIVYKNGQLEQLNGKDAWDYANQNKELIRFDSPEEADWFSKNYKKIWRK